MRWLRRETGWSYRAHRPARACRPRVRPCRHGGSCWRSRWRSRPPASPGPCPSSILALGRPGLPTRAPAPAARSHARLPGEKTGEIYRGGQAPLRPGTTRVAVRSRRFQSPANPDAGDGSWGLIGWAAEGVAFWFLLDWMGADVGLSAAVAIFIFATLARRADRRAGRRRRKRKPRWWRFSRWKACPSGSRCPRRSSSGGDDIVVRDRDRNLPSSPSPKGSRRAGAAVAIELPQNA